MFGNLVKKLAKNPAPKVRLWTAASFDGGKTLGRVKASSKDEAMRKARKLWGLMLCYVMRS